MSQTTNKEFLEIATKQFDTCIDLLNHKYQSQYKENHTKEKEKEKEDRFAHFKKGGVLTNQSGLQFLATQMAKHTLTLNDIIPIESMIPPALFIEVITDHINYLLLLRGMLEEIWLERNPPKPKVNPGV